MSAYLALPTLHGFAKASLKVAMGLFGLVGTALYFGQKFMIYPSYVPTGARTEVWTPDKFEIPYEDVELVTPDGVKVKLYVMLQRKELVGRPATKVPEDLRLDEKDPRTEEEYIKSRPTVLVFHANAGNVGHRIPLAMQFYSRMRCNIVMLSYRGYGLSEGSPSEKGIRIDAQATLDYVLAHPLLRDTKLITYGQSIGGAVSIDLASRNSAAIHALILENTFRDIRQIARHLFPLLTPFLFLCTENWRSEKALSLIPPSTHLLLLSGLQDQLVPPAHMKALWSIVKPSSESDSKYGHRVWREFPFGTHSGAILTFDFDGSTFLTPYTLDFADDTYAQEGYWESAIDFVRRVAA